MGLTRSAASPGGTAMVSDRSSVFVPAKRVDAMHVLWSAPFDHGLTRHGQPRTGYEVPVAEIVTAIHSVFAWRAFHGDVELYADPRAAELLSRYGLADLYSRINTACLDAIDVVAFDPFVYYTLAKVFALIDADRPIAILDMDLYLRQPIRGLGCEAEFVFSHYESVCNDVYPPLVDLPDPNHVVNPSWEESLSATNTSIAYFGSDSHRRAFARSALAFCRHNNEHLGLHRDVRPAFAEQRISHFEAVSLGVSCRPVAPTTWLLDEGRWSEGSPNRFFHHTWLRKGRMARDSQYAAAYLIRQVGALLGRFPDSRGYLETLVSRQIISSEVLRIGESIASSSGV